MNGNGASQVRRYGRIGFSEKTFFHFIVAGFPFPVGTKVIDVMRADTFEVMIESPFLDSLKETDQVPEYEMLLASHPSKPGEVFFHGYRLKNKPLIHLPGNQSP